MIRYWLHLTLILLWHSFETLPQDQYQPHTAGCDARRLHLHLAELVPGAYMKLGEQCCRVGDTSNTPKNTMKVECPGAEHGAVRMLAKGVRACCSLEPRHSSNGSALLMQHLATRILYRSYRYIVQAACMELKEGKGFQIDLVVGGFLMKECIE